MTSLTLPQARRLSHYCGVYRGVLLHQHPSIRRNQAMRAAQAVQGRLCGWTSRMVQEAPLLLCQEEARTLRQIVVVLLRQQRTTHPCDQRTVLLAELAETLVLLNSGRGRLS